MGVSIILNVILRPGGSPFRNHAQIVVVWSSHKIVRLRFAPNVMHSFPRMIFLLKILFHLKNSRDALFDCQSFRVKMNYSVTSGLAVSAHQQLRYCSIFECWLKFQLIPPPPLTTATPREPLFVGCPLGISVIMRGSTRSLLMQIGSFLISKSCFLKSLTQYYSVK